MSNIFWHQKVASQRLLRLGVWDNFPSKSPQFAHGYAHLAVWNHGSTGTSSIFHLTCAARSSWLSGFHKASSDQNSSKLRHSGWKLDSFHGMKWMSFGRACSSSCLWFALQISPSHSPHCELEHGHWPISPLHQQVVGPLPSAMDCEICKVGIPAWALCPCWTLSRSPAPRVPRITQDYPATQVAFPWDPFPRWISPHVGHRHMPCSAWHGGCHNSDFADLDPDARSSKLAIVYNYKDIWCGDFWECFMGN